MSQEQIQKTIPKQRRETPEIDDLPEIVDNEVSQSATEFLARTATVHSIQEI